MTVEKMPLTLREAVGRRAREEGVTMSELVITILRDALAEDIWLEEKLKLSREESK
jgi:hypothetical protein